MLGSLIIQTSEAGWWQLPPPELSRVSRGVGSNDGVFQGPRDMPRRSDRSTARRGMSSRYRAVQLRALTTTVTTIQRSRALRLHSTA